MPVDPADFRRALGQFAAGVTVVTTRDGQGRSLGLTVTAFASASLEPPLVLICVDHRSETHIGFRHAGLFGVSILAEGQEEVSRRFAVGGAAKFKGLELAKGSTGVPLIPGALAHLECRVFGTHLAGDHTIYVGEVLSVDVRPGRPLLYHDRDYRRLASGDEPEG
ncbi:MAG TPA: flavin reductase family protein [Vicinamibacteria bacterium]|jgi:flavin reductase (DIM6/NTAB) family NADH-FMN oxidoreductase RutF